MQTVFSTADVPRAEAFDYWQDALATQFRRRKATALDRHNFYAYLQAGALCDLGLVTCCASPVITSPGASSDDFLLVLPSSPVHLEFTDHSFETKRSDLYLIDAREPYLVARSLEPIQRTLVRIPHEALERERRVPIANVVNRPLPLDGDLGLLAGFVQALVRADPSTLSPPAAGLVRDQMLDLTAVAIGNKVGVTPRLGAAARFGTLKVRAAIESQVANPDADRQSIASAAGISERHANRLLALEGTSIRRLLTERRFAKCRAAFEDPLQRHRSIGDIALACGFRNLSHFTHAFKDRYGLAPSDYRSTFWSGGTFMSRTDK